jgi:putative ABC transport system ATP-binding protein
MNKLVSNDRQTEFLYFLDEVNVSTLGADERAEIRNTKIGFVFQNFNLLPRTSAQENVELPLLYSAISVKDQRVRAFAALKAVGLTERAHHLQSQLSGGQQQRVAIARALVTNPVLILADEPTGNLDSATSLEVMHTFTTLNQQGMTVLVVTHESDIAAFAQRRVVFRDGIIITDERH